MSSLNAAEAPADTHAIDQPSTPLADDNLNRFFQEQEKSLQEIKPNPNKVGEKCLHEIGPNGTAFRHQSTDYLNILNPFIEQDNPDGHFAFKLFLSRLTSSNAPEEMKHAFSQIQFDLEIINQLKTLDISDTESFDANIVSTLIKMQELAKDSDISLYNRIHVFTEQYKSKIEQIREVEDKEKLKKEQEVYLAMSTKQLYGCLKDWFMKIANAQGSDEIDKFLSELPSNVQEAIEQGCLKFVNFSKARFARKVIEDWFDKPCSPSDISYDGDDHECEFDYSDIFS